MVSYSLVIGCVDGKLHHKRYSIYWMVNCMIHFIQIDSIIGWVFFFQARAMDGKGQWCFLHGGFTLKCGLGLANFAFH